NTDNPPAYTPLPTDSTRHPLHDALPTSFNVPISNTGTVDVESGTINLAGGGSASGAFTIGAGTLNITNGTFTFQDGAQGSGAGIELMSGGLNPIHVATSSGICSLTK